MDDSFARELFAASETYFGRHHFRETNEVCQRKNPPSAANICWNPWSSRENKNRSIFVSLCSIPNYLQTCMPATVSDFNYVYEAIVWHYHVQSMEISGLIWDVDDYLAFH